MFRRSHVLVGLSALVALTALVVSGCGGGGEETNAGTQEDATTAAVDAREGVGTGDGQFPPAFTLPDLEGNDVKLSDFEGNVVVLDLWATWCPPCRQEIPFLVSLYEEFKDQGLVVLGVGLDQGGAPTLIPFAEENGITYPVVVGNRDVQALYGVTGIPTTFMIGRDGRISTKRVGYHPSMAEEMRGQVMALLSGEAEA
ncbi:MAG: TlpA disulfide reductase family protein [Candidatus Eisenbacteria bacterium]